MEDKYIVLTWRYGFKQWSSSDFLMPLDEALEDYDRHVKAGHCTKLVKVITEDEIENIKISKLQRTME